MSWKDELGAPEFRPSRAQLERLLDGRADRPDALFSSRAARHRPRSAFRGLGPKLAAAKLLTVGGVALAATGGVAATAASLGQLPNPLPHSSHASSVAAAAVKHRKPPNTLSPSASATAAAGAVGPTHAIQSTNGTGSGSGSASASASPSSSHSTATPSPSLRGLCQSWLSRPHEHGKADTNPAFTVLVTAAGGSDAVPGYCNTLLSTAPGQPTPSDNPTSDSPSPASSAKPSHSTGKPSSAPSPSHPTGKPTAVPSHSHPSGN